MPLLNVALRLVSDLSEALAPNDTDSHPVQGYTRLFWTLVPLAVFVPASTAMSPGMSLSLQNVTV